MTAEQRRAAAVTAWRSAVLLVMGKATWDAVGMLVLGNAAFSGVSYQMARQHIPGGMRMVGVPLVVLAGMSWVALLRRGSPQERLIRWCLSLLAAWNVGWLATVIGSWVTYQTLPAWPAIGSLTVVSGVAWLAARTPPPRAARPLREG